MKRSRDGGIDRREFLRMAGIAGIAMVGAACAPAAAPTATPTKAPPASSPAAGAPTTAPAAVATPNEAEQAAKLYEAAKKEGEVMVYNQASIQEWEEIGAAFQKKYPGIKVDAFAGTSEAMRDKVLTEAKARKVVGDVMVRANMQDTYTFTQEGVFEPYLSPQDKYFDEKHYDPKGLWHGHARYPHVIEYNVKSITKEQAPKSYADLLKPEFKGKLGLEANAVPWFSGMLRIMGRDKGLEYMKKLAEQKPRLISGHTSLHKLVTSGEIPVAAYMYSFRAVADKENGLVEWVNPTEGTSGDAVFVAVVKNTTHPNAARLVLDFVLSEEVAQIMVKQLYIPLRKGAELGKLADIAKVQSLVVTDVTWGKEVADNDKTFREIFGKP